VLSSIAEPIGLTLTLAVLVTALLLVLATPLAWWLSQSRAPWKEAVAAVAALPLVLPPTVLGFYLLLAFGPFGPGGALASLWGARTLAFSFEGLVVGSLIYSLPFMVQPLRNAFEAMGREPLESAATLGAGRWATFFRVALPQARAGYMAGAVLTFAHTIGEFGVVLMIGGNIPGETKVLSIAIYDFVERLQWTEAHVVAAGMVAFAFVTITATMLIERRAARG
jgi:molybdate transport system permease protein